MLAFARRDELFFSEDLTKNPRGIWTPLPTYPAVTSPELVLNSGQYLSIPQHSPFTWSVKLRRPHDDTPTQINLKGGGRGRYELSFDGKQLQVTLSRRTPENQVVFLQQWLLPHDTWQGNHHVEQFDLATTPRGTRRETELTLFYNEQLVGVAVDLDPLPQGDVVGLDSTSLGDVTLSYSAVQTPQP